MLGAIKNLKDLKDLASFLRKCKVFTYVGLCQNLRDLKDPGLQVRIIRSFLFCDKKGAELFCGSFFTEKHLCWEVKQETHVLCVDHNHSLRIAHTSVSQILEILKARSPTAKKNGLTSLLFPRSI